MLTTESTIGQFLFEQLLKEGITEIFGVPGDYNFSLLDILEHFQGIQFINCCNELNAGYAADGYARLKGFAALITTFGVGELSACNAIAGAYSESVPIIHIVGAPKSMVIKNHKIVHHTLLDGDFDVFSRVYKNLTAYTAFVTAENAAIEIPAAIGKARETKKPVYLVIPIDIPPMKLQPRDFMPIQRKTSPPSMAEALKLIRPMIASAQRPVLLSDVYVLRYHMENRVNQLAEKLNVPVATMMMGKGSYDESQNRFIGFYNGQVGSDAVRNIVEISDCIITIGAVWDDYNTGYFTAKLDPLRIIEIMPEYTKVGEAVFQNMLMEDILDALISSSTPKTNPLPQPIFPYTDSIPPTDAALSAAYYYPRIQTMLQENDIVVAETGTFFTGLAQLRLKRGITYITQGGWGSIGYATPAAFGTAIAARDRRVLLFTGDGALQLTAQEISTMLKNGCRPIIFVLNNAEYTIEKYINTPAQTTYNDIPSWRYTTLPEAFGGNAFVARAATEKEFDMAIIQAQEESKTRLCLIEMVTPSMDAPQIMHRTKQILEQMQKRN